ncbi:MAG TPA: dihydrolipoamide acetyltransferase family protein [Gemmatimonadaceae bacterium]|nr:dihydrolipoamide acetyltransferase family protein [Gemmatimonadaceae bacterium]
MPSLGADMEYGTLIAWRVAPGARVRRGDIVAEVETQKGVVEVEIFDSGVVEEIMVGEGTRVPVGAVLARIRSGDGAVEPAPAPEPAPARATTAPSPAPPAAEPSPPPPRPTREAPVRASPAARRLAAAHGMDLAALAGTGPDGAVTLADVERARERAARPTAEPPLVGPHRVSPVAQRVAAARGVDIAALAGTGPRGVVTRADVERAAEVRAGAAAQPSAPPAGTVAAGRQAAMRQAIAAAMTRSNREIPHYYLATDIDVSGALRWLEGENLKRPLEERVLPAALLLKAIALGLRDAPELNGYWQDGAFRPAPAIHLGIAISLRGGGLVAPAIHDAAALPLGELMHALHDLVRRARTGTLRSSELTDATITVTNLGDQGVRTVFGVIYPPQVALVGVGRVSERPWAEHGMVGARAVVTMTLAADHRASDGHRGALFLAAVDRILQTPERL